MIEVRKGHSRREVWICIALFVLALLLRAPFRSRLLYHWDSVNFALSLTHYDVRLHQPHPPGYFLYSLMGMLVRYVVSDENAALVWLSVVSGALGVVALYWLSSVVFSRAVGLGASVLALVNPMHWFYSEVALSYALEFLIVTVIAGLCYRQMMGHTRNWFWLAILMAVAGGVRQNDIVFLMPLWLVSLWALSWKRRVWSVVVVAAVTLAWLWPMVTLSGGVVEYWLALKGGGALVAQESSFFSLRELAKNIARMGVYLGYSVLLGIVPLVLRGWSWLKTLRIRSIGRKEWFFCLWIAPSFLFYVFVHIRQHGHIFTFLPAVLVLVAASVFGSGVHQGRLGQMRMAGVVLGLLAISSGLFFALAPESLFGSQRLPMQIPGWQSIRQRDLFLRERIDSIRARFDPSSTVVLAAGLNYRHPDYYFPEFQDTFLSYELPENLMTLSDRVRTLVLFDDRVFPQVVEGTELQFVVLGSGERIRYVTWGQGQRLSLNKSHFVIHE